MIKRNFIFLSLIFVLLLALWWIFTIVSMPQGEIHQQISGIYQSSGLYVLNFTIALSISPFLVLMLISFYSNLPIIHEKSILRTTAIMYIIYMLLISVSYGSQVIIFMFSERFSPGSVLRWYFYNDSSYVAYVNQSGYLLWSISTIFLFIKTLKQKGIPLIIIVLLYLIAIGQICASLGLYFKFSHIISGLTFYCGILLLPVGVLCIIYGIRIRRLTAV